MNLRIFVLVAAASGAHADLEVVGIIESHQRPVVILRSGARTRTAGVGELAFGHRVVAIANRVATLEHEGRRIELRLTHRGPETPALPAAPTASRPAAPSTAADYPSASVRVFKRSQLDERLADEMPRLLAETTVVPEHRDGRVVGLRLSRMPAGSLLLDAGLYAGDVLTRINGVDIDGMGTLIGLWPRLQSASELEATVIRNGEPFNVHVGLR